MGRASCEVLQQLEAGRTWGWDEAAGYLGCTAGTLKVWVSRRRIPHLKVGRLTRFRKSDLDMYLDAHLVEAER